MVQFYCSIHSGSSIEYTIFLTLLPVAQDAHGLPCHCHHRSWFFFVDNHFCRWPRHLHTQEQCLESSTWDRRGSETSLHQMISLEWWQSPVIHDTFYLHWPTVNQCLQCWPCIVVICCLWESQTATDHRLHAWSMIHIIQYTCAETTLVQPLRTIFFETLNWLRD